MVKKNGTYIPFKKPSAEKECSFNFCALKAFMPPELNAP